MRSCAVRRELIRWPSAASRRRLAVVDLGFRGEVVDLYHRYRRGYPPEVIDSVVAAFALSERDVVVDLGCGTGQLTLPMAPRVRAVLGVDPEPDMLARARRAAGERGYRTWPGCSGRTPNCRRWARLSARLGR